MPHPAAAPQAPSLDRTDLGLYATLVLVWGTSWYAIHHQLGVVAPVVSLLWRFLLAAALCVCVALWRGERMAWPARLHLRFAAAGVLMFSTNFLLFYLAGRHVPTGLLAVVFALASPINLGLSTLFFRRPLEPRVLAGAAIGIAGVGCLYAPEIAGTGFDAAALGGLALSVAGTCCFCLGNMVSATIQEDGVGDRAATAWGMVYGSAWLFILCLAIGAPFSIDLRPPYLISLVWLAAGSSVAAFIAYLALIKRMGPARAGFATVLFPVVALAISSLFEDYHWGPLAIFGVGLVAVGNVVVLGLFGRSRSRPQRPKADPGSISA
ncbi:MAG: EamA family transporter [Ancylobacter novellus]|uniref:EamA family transporter n=1 Tax=Ancylobacter novellus TaxID=921 RepID=A0A2W5M8Q7_ANCNO|nr:MAG: EamA family transporter [Ancylobacter novellus]